VEKRGSTSPVSVLYGHARQAGTFGQIGLGDAGGLAGLGHES
jgi:hypothetical protein